MGTNSNTLSRQWLMLQGIPRYPRKTTAGQLAKHLLGEGYDVTKRTVERDLAALSESFPIVCDDRAKPFGWSWQKDARQFSLPGMSPLQAMVLELAHTHLQPLLPAHLLNPLQPYFRQAEATLREELGKRGVAEWSRRVAVVQPAQPLLPPKIAGTVLAAVHEAVAKQRQLDLHYRSRSASKVMHYRVHPLGIIYRGGVGYLVGTIGDYEDVRQFALHRIEAVTALDESARQLKGFDLQEYAHSGTFGFHDHGSVKLVLRMEAPAAEHLHETPLSGDQTITVGKPNGWVRVQATVHDTSQLRWWLLAFGSQVEVLSPAELVSSISAELRLAASLYRCA